jgi:CubicO group peptidase (beta-lactamase class C family)
MRRVITDVSDSYWKCALRKRGLFAMHTKCIFVLLFILGSATLSHSQDLNQWTDSYIRGLAPAKHFSGIIVAEKDSKVVIEKSYGSAVEEWRIPNSSDTKFEIASVSKQFTAAAILQLADSEKLNVEDPVSKYYPEAPSSWKGMTIHHLLTHTSGLPEDEWVNFYKGKCTTYSTEEQVKTFRDRPLGFPPGGAWKYRNTEYYLLAYIIEKLSGESYAAYLAHHIFEPLKMTHSGFAPMAAVVPQMSEGYSREGGALVRREYFDRSMETGAGGIYSTSEDMLRWNKALDSPGVLSSRALELMFTAHPPGNYGYGWFVESSPRRRIYHEGGDPGFAAFEVRYPDQHFVIIVMANEDDSPVREIADAIAAHLFGD